MYYIVYVVCLLLGVEAGAVVKLKDIGVIGLSSHDLFAWDSKNEVNRENGRLDLRVVLH